MKASTVVPAPGSGAEAEALIKEARRRQRRRYAVTGLAMAAVLAGALVAFAGRPGASHPPPVIRTRAGRAAGHPAGAQVPGHIPRSLDTTVLMWPAGFGQCCGPVAVDNLSTGHLSQRQRPAISAGDYQPLLIKVGHWLVYVGNGATAIRADLTGRPRVLGRTPFFAASAVPGRVLLEYWSRRAGRHRVRSAPVSGGRPGPAITLPRGAQLIEGTDAGFLLQDSRSRLVLWNPGAKPRVLPHSSLSVEGFDASPQLVVYGTGCKSYETASNARDYEPDAGYDACRELRALNVVTGRLASFRTPHGTAGWVPNGFGLASAIAPGDKMIAGYAAVRPQGQGRTRLYLLRLAGAGRPATAVPSSAAFLFARTGWSARGSWLLYQGPGTHLWAYQVTNGKVRSSRTPCCRYTVMTTVRSQPPARAGDDHRGGAAGSGP